MMVLPLFLGYDAYILFYGFTYQMVSDLYILIYTSIYQSKCNSKKILT